MRQSSVVAGALGVILASAAAALLTAQADNPQIGKDMPVSGNRPYGDTTAISHVDANTTRTVYKNKGQVTSFKYPSSRPTGRRER